MLFERNTSTRIVKRILDPIKGAATIDYYERIATTGSDRKLKQAQIGIESARVLTPPYLSRLRLQQVSGGFSYKKAIPTLFLTIVTVMRLTGTVPDLTCKRKYCILLFHFVSL